MGTHKGSDELRFYLFQRTFDHARPSIAELAQDARISPSLIDKIRWRQRRPTDSALNAFADRIEDRARWSLHYARLLRAAASTKPTDLADLDCRADGTVELVSDNVSQALRREPAEICGGSYTDLFDDPPKLQEVGDAQQVALRHTDGSVETAIAVATRTSPQSQRAYWRLSILIEDPQGPRSQPPEYWEGWPPGEAPLERGSRELS
jgi:hypothetical protein